MARKKATAESPPDIVKSVADGTQMPQEQAPPANANQPPAREPGDDSHLEEAKKTWSRASMLQGLATFGPSDGGNKVHVYNDRDAKAYLIYFDRNPNEGRAKDDPHPALKAIKEAGYGYNGRVGDHKAWKKPYADRDFSYAEEQQQRRLGAELAAELNPEWAKSPEAQREPF